MVAMELLPGVARLAQGFREQNRGVLGDPRVELRLADGRNHLFGSVRRYDAIVGDLFLPWHAGTGTLYTVEHFTNVRERLRDGGVFVQWLQLNQASPDELRESWPRASVAAFDDAELWLNSTHRERPLLAFVGYAGARARARNGSARCAASAERNCCGSGARARRSTPTISRSSSSRRRPATTGVWRSGRSEAAAVIDWLRAEERKRS